MRSRVVREGSVGLLILLGLGLTVGIAAWLRGANLGGHYSLGVELADAVGLNVGSPVKYRGVKVGRVHSLTPSINGVIAQVDISPPSIVIPRDSSVSVTQSGFIGQVELSIQPKKAVATAVASNLSPYRPNCNESVILCDGDRLTGGVGANFDELIQSTTKLANLLSENELIDNANASLKSFTATSKNINLLTRNTSKTLRDVSVAANGFTELSQDTRQQLKQFGPISNSVTRAADQVSIIGNRLGTTATDISSAANQVTSLVQVNRSTLTSTLGNLQSASQDLKVAVKDLSPVINRIEKGKLLDNLETLAENGAKASANLKNLTATVNNPATVLGLAQTLDSARVTFQNTQKITTDLEQVTGNPKFRQNLIKLINGLSKLVSSSQTLDQQLSAMASAHPDSAPQPDRIDLLHSNQVSSEISLPLGGSDANSPIFSSDRFEANVPALTEPQASFSDPFLTQSLRPSTP
jgi:phospholipid/cholesterol/gamma-HCH transport system substrate-binding protein